MTMGWSHSNCEIWGQMVVFQCPKMTINDMTVENSCVCHGTPAGGAGSYPQCLRNVQQQAYAVLHIQNPECLLLKGFFSPLLQPSLFSIGLPKSSRKTCPFLTDINKVLQCKASRCFHLTANKLLHLL